MRLLMFGAFLLVTPGCAALSALTGVQGPQDVFPSLKYCPKVMYYRDGSQATIHAECNMPVGT